MSNLAELGARSAIVAAPMWGNIPSPAGLLENAPIGIYACDRDGVLVQYNRRATALWGLEPTIGMPLSPNDAAMREVLATGNSIRDRETIIEQPDGKRLTVLANVDPLFDEAGRLSGAVNCFQDVTELKRMQKQLRDGAKLFRDLLEALPVAIYTTDAAGKITFFNQAAVELSGRSPVLGTDEWCVTLRLYLPDGTPLPHPECPMAVALKEKRALIGPEAVAERPDGTRVPFMPYPTPIFDRDGTLLGAVNMLIDLTERKHAEAHQKSLIDELNHRVKNTLATVQSLAAQTMRNPGIEGREVFEARLLALSRTHDQLSRECWESADLKSILHLVFAPYRDRTNDHVKLRGESVRLQPKTALTLALVFHELATNAAKYGSLSVPEGVLDISWKEQWIDGNAKLHMEWREHGGPKITAPARRGFGSRLVERSLCAETGSAAKMDFLPDGLCCTFVIALNS